MPSSYWTAHTWASSPSSLRTTPPPRSRRAHYRESPQPITLYAHQFIPGPAEADGLDPPGLDRQAPLRPLATAKTGWKCHDRPARGGLDASRDRQELRG